MNGSNNNSSRERAVIESIESILTGVILWTLFLPVMLAFLTMKSDKRKTLLIFLTVFVIFAYSLAIIQSVNYVRDAIDFKRDVLTAMINDRIDPLEQSEFCQPMQNIPDVFSYTMVDEAVAIYHPDALSPDWSEEYEDFNNKLSALKYDSIVFVTANGEKFHLDGCRHLKDGGKELIYQVALTYGYTPCKVCFGN